MQVLIIIIKHWLVYNTNIHISFVLNRNRNGCAYMVIATNAIFLWYQIHQSKLRQSVLFQFCISVIVFYHWDETRLHRTCFLYREVPVTLILMLMAETGVIHILEKNPTFSFSHLSFNLAYSSPSYIPRDFDPCRCHDPEHSLFDC